LDLHGKKNYFALKQDKAFACGKRQFRENGIFTQKNIWSKNFCLRPKNSLDFHEKKYFHYWLQKNPLPPAKKMHFVKIRFSRKKYFCPETPKKNPLPSAKKSFCEN
jgi:hypothetical protein